MRQFVLCLVLAVVVLSGCVSRQEAKSNTHTVVKNIEQLTNIPALIDPTGAIGAIWMGACGVEIISGYNGPLANRSETKSTSSMCDDFKTRGEMLQLRLYCNEDGTPK